MQTDLLQPAWFATRTASAATGRTRTFDATRIGLDPGGRAVALFWLVVIAIDLGNDWLLPGLTGGVRPLGIVAREITIWWSTWVLATPLLLALSGRIAHRGRLRAALGWIGLALIAVPLHLFVTAALFRAGHPGAGSALGMARRFAVDYTLAEVMTLGGLLLSWHGARAWSAARTAKVQARTLAIRAGHADRLERERSLASLRRELDDHLLVNVLTSAAAVIGEGDEDRAVRMLARVGDLVRAGVQDATVVPLSREIDLLDRYLAVEDARFGAALAVERDIDADARGALLPPLLLQPLVENAIRYGLDPARPRTTVRLVARRVGDWVDIEVHNEATADCALREGRGISVVRRRVAEAFDGAAAFGIHRENGGVVARLRIPFRDA